MENSHRSRNEQEAREGAHGEADVRRDWLVPFLLLCLRDEGCYAHQLEEKLDELGFGGIRLEMHRALWQIEWEGMVLCDHEGDGFGLLQGWYEITEAGESYLEFWADFMVRYQREVDLFLELYTERRAQGALG